MFTHFSYRVICIFVLMSMYTMSYGAIYESSCSQFPQSGDCTQCFYSSLPLKEGYERDFTDSYTNLGDHPHVIYLDEQSGIYSWKVLQDIQIDSDIQVTYINPIPGIGIFRGQSSGRDYYEFPPYSGRIEFIKNVDGKGIYTYKIGMSVDENAYALKTKWTLRYRSDSDNLQTLRTHSECVYYKAQKSYTPPPPPDPFCGDGNLDPGEQCDYKDPNKTNWGPGGCDTDCKPIFPPPPPVNYCGDGIVQTPNRHGEMEQCDFGPNPSAWAGKDCVAPDFSKLGDPQPGACIPKTVNPPPPAINYCGDGIIQTPNRHGEMEQCDHGSNPTDWQGKDCIAPDFSKLGDPQPGACISKTVNPPPPPPAPFCGDGHLDPGEQCDYNDPSKTGWGPGGCDTSCKPIDGGGPSGPPPSPSGPPSPPSGPPPSSGPSGPGTPPPVNYCGDGIVQRPNRHGEFEECDYGPNPSNWAGTDCIPPDFSRLGDPQPGACRIISKTIVSGPGPGPTCWNGTCTYPGGLKLTFSSGRILVGGGVNIGQRTPLEGKYKVTITNPTSGTIKIGEKFCITLQRNDSDVIQALQPEYCIEGNKHDDRYGGKHFEILPGVSEIVGTFPPDAFMSSTQGLGDKRFADAQLVTTFDGWVLGTGGGILNVRVARPSVGTIGGGASLISGDKISDINELTKEFDDGSTLYADASQRNKIRNLMFLSLGNSRPLSTILQKTETSNTGKKEDTTTVNEFQKSEEKVTEKLQRFGASASLSTGRMENYNGLPNVFVYKGDLKTSDFGATSGFPIPTQATTYIIEDGDLLVDRNFTSLYNILFVVKNKKIKIDHDVTRIEAVLMNFGDGIFSQTDDATPNILTIRGAVYGNMENLLKNRTHIEGKENYVEVGTNIQFTSNIFADPPPLMSTFLGQYISSQKVPK